MEMWTFPGTKAAGCQKAGQGCDGTADLRRETRPGELESLWQMAAVCAGLQSSMTDFEV